MLAVLRLAEELVLLFLSGLRKISFLSLTGVNGNQFLVVSLLRWPLHTLGCAYTLPPTPTLLCPQVDCPLVSFNNE